MMRVRALSAGVFSVLLPFAFFSTTSLSVAFPLGADANQLSFPFVPDPAMTTGSLCDEEDPDFKEHRYDEKIPYCRRNVSSALKSRIYIAYGVASRCKREYTIDHFVPLALGGTNRADNLWPEPKSVKALRANLEQHLYLRMEKGRITQEEAVEIVSDAKWNPPVGDPSDYEFCR